MEYKHKWQVPREAWYMKYLEWYWFAPSGTFSNFCLFFWGMSISILLSPLRILLIPLVMVWKVLIAFLKVLKPTRKVQEVVYVPADERLRLEKEKRQKWQNSLRYKFICKISELSTRVSVWCSAHKLGQKLSAMFVVFWIGIIVFFLIHIAVADPHGLLYEALSVLAVLSMVGIISLLSVMYDKGMLGFFGRVVVFPIKLMWTGACAVKSRTCPEIILTEEKK